MTNQEILEKAIQKAIESGWNADVGVLFVNKTPKYVAKYIASSRVPEVFIFNHDFAKALWGEDPTGWKCEHCGLVTSFMAKYKVHLQQMVVADDPIQYLGEHI